MKILPALIALLFFATGAAYSQTKPIIAQYFGIWTDQGQTWEDKFRADTPFDKLNRLYICFGKLIKTSEGHFTLGFDGPEEHVITIINHMKQVNPDAELFLIVGGDGSSMSFGGAANDPQFAENVAKFLAKYGFNGFDIDWETLLNKDALNNLVTHMYTTLHSKGFKLTLDVWPTVKSAYDMTVLRENLDQVNIMSYGTFRKLSDSVTQFVNAGFPANKLIGGVITESHYYGGTDSLGKNGSIAEKSSYALQHGLAGMMGWRLDNDYAQDNNRHYPTYRGAIELWNDMTIQPSLFTQASE